MNKARPQAASPNFFLTCNKKALLLPKTKKASRVSSPQHTPIVYSGQSHSFNKPLQNNRISRNPGRRPVSSFNQLAFTPGPRYSPLKLNYFPARKLGKLSFQAHFKAEVVDCVGIKLIYGKLRPLKPTEDIMPKEPRTIWPNPISLP